MKDTYWVRKLGLIAQQSAIIILICAMALSGNFIERDKTIHFLLLSLLFWDAAYISYRNIKENRILKHFSYLLSLLGWQFLLELFDIKESAILLPLCLYQSFYFLQTFIFQASVYQWQKQFLLLCKSTCILSVVGFAISNRAFFIAYQIQYLLSLSAMFLISFAHRQRIRFLLRSQKKELFRSTVFVMCPFICYIAAFYRDAEYMSSIGSYLCVMLAFFSVHSILFQYHPQQERFFVLGKSCAAILSFAGAVLFFLIGNLFEIPIMTIFVFAHSMVLFVLLYDLILYLQIIRHSDVSGDPPNHRHFYVYALTQIKREEALKKEFSNYLHDNILQDLLSVKNLLGKADDPKIKQLLYDSLNQLNRSIRLQMQEYHPTILKSLTLKENLQNILETLTAHSSLTAVLDCDDAVFLVEPYNILICRMIRELTVNAVKHANASKIRILLIQERGLISLKVSDNGTGFDPVSCRGSDHRGLASIQEQVSLLDGTMSIQTSPGTGTRVFITMPMRGEDSYESFIDR